MTAISTQMGMPTSHGAGVSVAFSRLAAVLVCVIGEIVLAMWLGIIPAGGSGSSAFLAYRI